MNFLCEVAPLKIEREFGLAGEDIILQKMLLHWPYSLCEFLQLFPVGLGHDYRRILRCCLLRCICLGCKVSCSWGLPVPEDIPEESHGGPGVSCVHKAEHWMYLVLLEMTSDSSHSVLSQNTSVYMFPGVSLWWLNCNLWRNWW